MTEARHDAAAAGAVAQTEGGKPEKSGAELTPVSGGLDSSGDLTAPT
ncbi:MAG: hypothetical protein FWD68_17295 [Alphaproteobacteria bacterium]|nr:hypothetical protein [Alphaproteobacteria bacterium]